MEIIKETICSGIKCRICGGGVSIDQVAEIPYDLLTTEKGGLKYRQRIYECPVCGYVGVVNPFDEDVLRDMYANTAKYEGSPESRITTDDYSGFRERPQAIVCSNMQKQLLSSILIEIESVCDIGASTGYLLSILDCEERLGIEPSPRNKSIARHVYGVDIYTGRLQDYDAQFPEKKFDLMTASHVLEHIDDVVEFVRIIRRHAAKYVLVEVPTIEKRFKNRPYDLFIDEHISYFSLDVIKRLFEGEENGFHLVDALINFCPQIQEAVTFPSIITLWKSDAYDNTVETRHTMKMAGLRKNKEGFLKGYLSESHDELDAIKRRVESCVQDSKCAVFCAGAHTEKLFGCGFFENINIGKIYDNSEKKQGKYIAGIPVSRFCVDDMRSHGIGHIIVSTNNWQNDIVCYLEKAGVTDDAIVCLYE